MKLAIIFFLLVSSAWAATFTAVASGDWQAPTTWGTSGTGCHVAFPCMTDAGSGGDQVVIGNFLVTCGLTVTETCSAGTSTNDATTLAISLTTAGGGLTLANASTLVYAGTVSAVQGTTFTAGAGSRIQFDSTWAAQTATPSAVTMSGATATFTSAVNYPSSFVTGANFAAIGFTPTAYNRIWTITGGGSGTTSLTATSPSTTGLSAGTVVGTLVTDPLYRFNWGTGLATGIAPRLMLNGTTGAHITWQGDASLSPLEKPTSGCTAGACLAGAINLPASNCPNNIGWGVQSFVDYSNIWGLAQGGTNIAYCSAVGSTNSLGSIQYSNLTFTNCGTVRANVQANGDVNSIVISSIQLMNCSSASAGDSCFRYGAALTAPGPFAGTYSVTGLLANGGISANAGTVDSPFISRNFFLWTWQNSPIPGNIFGFPTSASPSGGVYDQIVMDDAASNLGATQIFLSPTFVPPSLSNSVIWADRTLSASIHIQLMKNNQNTVGTAGSYSQLNNVFGGVGMNDGSLSAIYTNTSGQAPSSPTTYLFQGNVQLCGYTGIGGSPTLVGSYINGAVASNLVNTVRGNTACNVVSPAGNQPTNGAGGAEAVTVASGAIASIDSNLFFSTGAGGVPMNAIQSPANPSASTTMITFLGFNGAVGASSYVQQNALNNFVATFGATGPVLATLPAFADRIRSVPLFDVNYLTPTGLLNVASYGASPWVTGHAYNVGDVISFSDPTVYNGQTTYWRCITAHTSGPTNEPYFGLDVNNPFTGFYVFWELAYWNFFRTQVINNQTFDQQCSALLYINCPTPHTYMSGLLNAWLRAGYVSMDVPLWRGCSSNQGATFQECGAMPLQPIQHIAAVMGVN